MTTGRSIRDLIDTTKISSSTATGRVCATASGWGPDVMRARKPSIVYVRHTGFGAERTVYPTSPRTGC